MPDTPINSEKCGKRLASLDVGGVKIEVRPLCPEKDRESLIRFYESLSEETIYTRFFSIIRYFDPHVDKLVSSSSVIALLAVDLGTGEIVGVGEAFIGSEGTAEGGIVVLEKYQGLGLGSLLARIAIDVLRAQGIKKLYGYVLSDNTKALRLASKLGAKIVREAPGIMKIEVMI